VVKFSHHQSGGQPMTKAVAANKLRAMTASKTTFSLIEYAEAESKLTGIPVTLENVYPSSIFTHKILKAQQQPSYNEDFPKVKKLSLLEPFANVADVYLKRAPKGSLENEALQLIKQSESEEQVQARLNAPVTDRAYIERSDYTMSDLYNDIRSVMEWYNIATYLMRLIIFGNSALTTYTDCLDWDYYREERKKFRSCRYKYCLNMFPIKGDNILRKDAKRSDSRYCCETCRKSSFDAEERYRKYGSYLPIYYYVEQTSEYIADEARLREVAKPIDVIDRRNAKGNATSPITGNRRRKPLRKHEFKPFLTVNIATGKVDYASENHLNWYKGH